MLKYKRILFAVLKLVALRLIVCSWQSKHLELQLANTSGYWQVSYATVLCKWLGLDQTSCLVEQLINQGFRTPDRCL